MKRNEFKIGGILSYLSILLSNIVGIVYTPIMLRSLGQAEYGIYSLVGSMISYMTIVDFGFGNATIRYISKYRALNDKEKEYSLNGMFIFINLIIGLLVLILGGILFISINFIFSNKLTSIEIRKIKIMLLILTFNLAISFPFNVFSAIITAYERFVFPKIVGIVRMFLNPIVILTVLSYGYKSIGMVVVNTIINIIFIWINMYYCFKVLNIKIYFRSFDLLLFKEIVNYSFFIFIAIIVDKIYWSTDQFILGVFSGSTVVAIYAVASQINMYYMQFSTSISGMFLPRITSMIINNASNKELTNIFIKIGRIQYIILGLVLSGFMLLGKEFIILWAGEEYYMSYYIALILIAPFTIPLIQNIGLSILQAKNMHKFRSISYFFIAIVNLIISIPLAKFYGAIGCAIGTSIAMIFGNIIIINIYYYKKVGIDIIKFWKEISFISTPIIISIFIGMITNKFIGNSGLVVFILKGILYIFIYSILVYFMGMNKYEKQIVKSFTNKICRKQSEYNVK